MRLNKHSELEGRHAFMSPSSPAWLRYDDDKLERVFSEHQAHIRGTKEHDFAAKAIELGQRMEDVPKTLNMYINDCIGWRMKPEVKLFWSNWCFGSADALGFYQSQMLLRISDLKTGKGPVKMDQLIVYAALFCLEYEFPRPWELEIELRIYQKNRVELYVPDGHEVFKAMDRILTGTRLIEEAISDYRS